MGNSRQIVAILFSLLIASSMVVVPASAAFAESAAQPTPRAGSGSAASLDAGSTGASVLEHATQTDVPEVGGATPQDPDGDGRYEDVTGDGAFTNADVTHFFGHQHLLEDDRYFDYNGDGDVGQADVKILFDAITADDRSTVIVPVEPTDADEDGLPDRFEANVAGTDPHDANSDSTLTAANESANDAPDGAEDLSGNGVPLAYAAENDLDPLENDTDGDGLSDRVEIRIRDMDPAVADTDGDGTSDGDADLDGDGLSNADEAERGTSLSRADSDGDGIEDGDEVELGTDPLAADTDEDGLEDGLEERFGTDATSADSDGDGTPDGNETFEVEHADETTGVTATATGTGATPTELSLEHLPRYDNTSDATAARTVLVSNVDQQENVTVRLPVTTNVSAADLSVYTRKPERNATWQEHGGEYDAAAGVATAELSGDREVTVLNATTWKASQSVSVYEGESIPNVTMTCEGSCAFENGSIIVGPDAPESKDTDSGSIGTLSIGNNLLTAPTLPTPPDAISDIFTDDSDDSDGDSDDSDDDSGDTSTDSGNAAPRYPPDGYDNGDSTDTSDDDGSTGSDGGDSSDSGDDGSDSPSFDGSDDDDDSRDDTGSDDTGDNSNTGESSSTATVSIPVDPEAVTLTIGYSVDGGSDDATITVEGVSDEKHLSADATYGDTEILSADVTEFGGEDVTVSVDASDSTANLEGLSVYQDADGDGLVDAFEEQSHTHPETRREFQTDPNLADTDGDGLDDGEEVSTSFNGEWWTIDDATSDPALADTDGDGVSDDDEIDVWETDPTASDTSGDGLNDLVDPNPLEETVPPSIELRSEKWTEYQVVKLQSGELESIEATAQYDPLAPGDDPFWSDDRATAAKLHGDGAVTGYELWRDEYPIEETDDGLVFFEPYGSLEEPPRNYVLTVSNEDATAEYVIEVSGERSRVVDGAIFAGGAFVASPDPATDASALVLAGAVLLGLAGGTVVDSVLDDGHSVEELEDTSTMHGAEVVESWEFPEHDLEITLPSGATIEQEITDNERQYGWDQVKELPGIESPQDVGEIIEDGDQLPGRGDYDLVIGDNPNDSGEVLLRLKDGLILSADVVEEFPGAEYGDHTEKRDEHETVLHRQQLEHIQNDHQVTTSEIRKAVNSPDEVWVTQTPQGQDLYMWVKNIGGDTIVVRAAAIGEQVRIGTSFWPDDGYSYVQDWIQNNGATQIYP